MDLSKSLETITLNEQSNYRLMEIGKIKDSFDQEIKDKQFLNKLSKYITCLDNTDKILTVSLTVFGGKNIFAHVRTKKRHLGLMTSVFSVLFCLSTGAVKKSLQETKARKKTQ